MVEEKHFYERSVDGQTYFLKLSNAFVQIFLLFYRSFNKIILFDMKLDFKLND